MRSPAEQRRSLVTPGSSRSLSIDDDVAMKNIFSKPAAPAEAWSAGTRRLFAGVVAGILVLAALFNYVGRDAEGAGSLRQTTRFPETFRIGVISDPDKKSKAKDKAEWRAQYMTGTLRRAGESYSVTWDEPASLGTGMNEAGRGAELSELVRWNGGLFAFDDRTGIMFEILHPEDSSAKGGKAEPQLVPRRIFMEGDGHNGKGMKFEWATVKDGQLYIGSFGKEYTNSAGETVHTNNLWVTVLDRDGRAQQLDWSPHYEAMRAQLGVSSPGYMIHEAVAWSPAHRRWFVLPRRVSKEAYDEAADEKRGSNHILSAAPDFSHIEHYTVGTVSPLRGFSSVKFLPGSKDSVIIALKSEENSERDRQTTYLTIYGKHPATGEWRVLLEETELPHEAKFEGLEVLSWS